MILHLLVSDLFGFDAADGASFAELELPSLERLLSRGRWQPAEPLALEAWLCRAFGVARQQDWPVAPLTLRLDGGTPGDAYWLRADPVHLQVQQDRVILADSGTFEIGQPEAGVLTDTLNRYFEAEGLVFFPMRPDRWYVRLDAPPRLQTHPVTDVAGRDVDAFLPVGEDAGNWRRRLTEIQMLLHEHPLNLEREAAGRLPVNSVWLWGGGRDPAPPQSVYTAVYARDPLARALALAAGIPARPLPASAREWLARVREEQALVVLDTLRGAVQYGDARGLREGLAMLESEWFSPLEAALENSSLERLLLAPVPAPARVEVAGSDLRKFWRLRKGLGMWAARAVRG